jgi:hypothetical protein
MKLCKDCRWLIWYKWWWPYFMGIAEIELREECDNRNNQKIFHDAVTGEDSCPFGWKRSPHTINEKGNCKWFERGRHEYNMYGEMKPVEESKLAEYRAQSQRSMRRAKRWWPF